MSWWRTRIIAIVLVALVSSVRVAGGTIVPIDQSRFTLAYVTTDCEGVTEEEEEAKDFGPFDSFVQTLQICDDLGIFASAEADQHSVIGASSMTADGRAFAAGESPSGLHAYSASFFELTFDLPLSSSFTAQGELGVAWGFPGGHDALFSLTGPGNQTIFYHNLVGDGGRPSTEIIEEAGDLGPGTYVLRAYASISPADLMPSIPFPEASFEFTFDLSIPGDLDGDGSVGIRDLLILFANWGPCPEPPDPCPADLNGDGSVGVGDLLILFANWG